MDRLNILIEEIALSGSVGIPAKSPQTVRNWGKKVNEHLEANGFRWRVRVNVKNQTLTRYVPGVLSEKEKTELAEEFMDYLCQLGVFYEVDIYTGAKRLSSDSCNGKERKSTAKGTVYYEMDYDGCPCEYNNPDTLTVTFEGPFYHLLNHGDDGKVYKTLQNMFAKRDLYFEMGYAWSFALYYLY